MIPDFKLWLEFEAVDPGNWDTENEFTNIHVDLPDGRHYGINVWTYKFLETAIKHDQTNGDNLKGLYQTPPDLFVKELTRDCIEKTIKDLLEKGEFRRCIKSKHFALDLKFTTGRPYCRTLNHPNQQPAPPAPYTNPHHTCGSAAL